MCNYVGDENKITLVLLQSEKKKSIFSCFQSTLKGRGKYWAWEFYNFVAATVAVTIMVCQTVR